MGPTLPRNGRRPPVKGAFEARCLGGDLLSHPVTRAVPSALEGLTSGFGMGPGVSPPPGPPKRRLAPVAAIRSGRKLRDTTSITLATSDERQGFCQFLLFGSKRHRAHTS